MSNYDVNEDAGSVEVCAVTNIGHSESFTATFSTVQTGNAVG